MASTSRSRVELWLLTVLAPTLLQAACSSGECTRNSDCPVGEYCVATKCEPKEDSADAPPTDAGTGTDSPAEAADTAEATPGDMTAADADAGA